MRSPRSCGAGTSCVCWCAGRARAAVSLGPLGVEVTDIAVGDVLDEDLVSRAIRGLPGGGACSGSPVHAPAPAPGNPAHQCPCRRAGAGPCGRPRSGSGRARVDVVALTRYGAAGRTCRSVTSSFRTPSRRSPRRRSPAGCRTPGAPVVDHLPWRCVWPARPLPWRQSERLRLDPARPLPAVAARAGCTSSMSATSPGDRRRLSPGRGPRRYIVPGHHVDGDQLFAAFADVTGRRFLHLVVPAPVMDPDPPDQRRPPSAARAVALPG